MRAQQLVIWIVVVFGALLFGNLVYLEICRYPADRDMRLEAHEDLASVCTQLTSGSDWRSAVQRLNERWEPIKQQLVTNQFSVQYRTAKCIVTFDPASGQVVNTQFSRLVDSHNERSF